MNFKTASTLAFPNTENIVFVDSAESHQLKYKKINKRTSSSGRKLPFSILLSVQHGRKFNILLILI